LGKGLLPPAATSVAAVYVTGWLIPRRRERAVGTGELNEYRVAYAVSAHPLYSAIAAHLLVLRR